MGENYIEYIPEELPPMYMFLPVSVYAIDHFTTETLWGSLPRSFNDPFDSLCVLNEQELKKHFEGQYKAYPNMFLPTVSIEQTINQLVDITRTQFENIRNNYFISCFTPNVESEIMWAHYGRNATGFALQYSAVDIIECAQKYFQKYLGKAQKDIKFCPVLYSDAPVDVTRAAKKIADGLLQQALARSQNKESNYHMRRDLVSFNTILFHKNECWSYEEEYRLCVQNFPLFINGVEKNHIEIGRCKPTAIYLGTAIEKQNEEILRRIAKEKEIPVYKMKAKIKNGRYCLEGEKID